MQKYVNQSTYCLFKKGCANERDKRTKSYVGDLNQMPRRISSIFRVDFAQTGCTLGSNSLHSAKNACIQGKVLAVVFMRSTNRFTKV